jgi:hypothetical protein
MSCSPTSGSLGLVGLDPIQHRSFPEGWCSRTGDRLQMPANRLGASLADWQIPSDAWGMGERLVQGAGIEDWYSGLSVSGDSSQ